MSRKPQAAEQAPARREHKTRTRRLPQHLPVIEEEAAPPAEVLAEPDAWRKTSCETSDQLEKEPGYFYLRRTVRWRYVPVDQPFATPVISPAKPRIIDNGFLGPGLLAELLANKYLYHLPFHRQHQLNLRRHGVDIDENTMHDAAEKVGDQLGILVARMKERMLAGGVVRSDETPVRCLDRTAPGGTAPGGSKLGYFWVYRGPSGDVIFDWQTSREHRHLAQWFDENFEGVLLSDGYQAYAAYCELQARRRKKVRRAACLAHIRRKFEAALKERPAVVAWILKQIAALYRIERDLEDHGATTEVRARVRHNRSLPLIRLLGKALKHLSATAIRPKSRLGEALHYALGQWSAMHTFLDDGRVAIDNNSTERDIRSTAVGKKNWLCVSRKEVNDVEKAA
ncbi:IS66 family transposase [Haloferula luteola]|uniref:IS66 family transposase n=1 Tax=Haloferula luteola TaxID=595692 RepID=UPI0031B576B3